MTPLVEELTPAPDVLSALQAVADLPGTILFESALRRDRLGRYSFLTADPFAFFELPRAESGCDPFAGIRGPWTALHADPVPGLPPFQGGAAGLLSYELGRAWESLPTPQHDEFRLPAMAAGLYDWVIAWDHAADRAWIISHGLPETGSSRRTDRAAARMTAILHRLESPPLSGGAPPRATRAAGVGPKGSPGGVGRPESAKGVDRATFDHAPPVGLGVPPRRSPQTSQRLAPQFPLPHRPGLTSDFSRDGYLRAVGRVIEHIYAGDIFQANLSQRLLAPQGVSGLDLYARLRQRNPAPFAGYFAHGDWAVASASPERFVCVTDGDVETRPIKGTRRRGPGPEADLFTRDELRQSEKDQAENVMIVDLLRNDLSRVCSPGTVHVPHLCRVETYETVQHLVSEVRGRLSDGRSPWDLLEAVFPGGSITGAPKVRAMEIIAELEPTVRGPYCGSLFYVGFDGSADSNLLIRTLTCRNGWVQCPVGGGIVAQSNPVAEYEETLHKAEGMLRAV